MQPAPCSARCVRVVGAPRRTAGPSSTVRAGRAHTPRAGCAAGRVAELVRTGKLALHGVRHFVLDEVRARRPRARAASRQCRPSAPACVQPCSKSTRGAAAATLVRAAAGAAGRRRRRSLSNAARAQADRLLDTGHRELILELCGKFPKAGAGVARLQARAPARPCRRARRGRPRRAACRLPVRRSRGAPAERGRACARARRAQTRLALAAQLILQGAAAPRARLSAPAGAGAALLRDAALCGGARHRGARVPPAHLGRPQGARPRPARRRRRAGAPAA